MAMMIPNVIVHNDIRSKEADLFEQLQANLSDEYYVFHSLRFCYEGKEHEADFVIMHPEKGIMCIECKSSYGGCSNGMCYYGNGEYMSDPYSQAADNSIFLRHLVLERLNADQTHIFDCVKKPHEFPCVFCWAVWFGIDKQSFINAKRNFPLLGNDNNTIFRDETMDPEKAQDRIEKVFAFASEAFKFRSNFKNILMPLVNRIMAPVFDIAPLPPTERSAFRFSRLLQEQMRVLDFLEEQNLTVINGNAGSGKTFIALEKARRLGANGDKVLFLCYNRKLKDYLVKNYDSNNGYDNITFDTIGNRVYMKCGDPNHFLQYCNEVNQMNEFEFNHIIVDEGQDFAQAEMNLSKMNMSLFEVYHNQILLKEGCFYIFYDKTQLVQGFGGLPEFINKADCKITLKRNCRNTQEITDRLENMVAIKYKDKDKQPSMPYEPVMYFAKDRANATKLLRNVIQKYRNMKLKNCDMVILSMVSEGKMKSDKTSCLGKNLRELGANEYEFDSVQVTTFRKFKGLESECVIIVDLDGSLLDDPVKLKNYLYVATSRARVYFDIIAVLPPEDLSSNIGKLREFNPEFENVAPQKSLQKLFAESLGMVARSKV